MKKIAKNGNKRKFLVSLLLVAAIAGASITMALAIATTRSVTNSFQAADHSSEIEEKVMGLDKDVTVKNTGKSDAFIRVRLVVSPKEKVELVFAEDAFKENEKGYWIKGEGADSGDGFYYFSEPVATGESTTKLLDAVKPQEGFTEMFDVTVYEESCVAKAFPNEGGKLEFMEKTFEEADGTSAVTE